MLLVAAVVAHSSPTGLGVLRNIVGSDQVLRVAQRVHIFLCPGELISALPMYLCPAAVTRRCQHEGSTTGSSPT